MRIISIIIIITLNINIALSQSGTIASSTVGQYVKFGQYFGDTILWRIIRKNPDNSAMLLSESILCIKPFDSKGDLTDGRGSPGGSGSRIAKGSNFWEKSNIREWLNSNETPVIYSGNPPKSEYTMLGLNAYDEEAGFLTNFTPSELSVILETKHKSLLAKVDAVPEVVDGGTDTHIDNVNLSDVVQNFDDAYFQLITDKVFLLDVQELYFDVWTNEALGGTTANLQLRKPTEQAVAHSEYIGSELNINTPFNYFLRTPNCNEENTVRSISPATPNKVHSGACFSSNGGILPALNVSDKAYIFSGDGSVSNPFVVSSESASIQSWINQSASGIYFFTNPTSGELTVQLPDAVEIKSIEMFDLMGNLCKKWIGEEFDSPLHLSDQHTGVYIFIVKTATKSYAHKVFLLR